MEAKFRTDYLAETAVQALALVLYFGEEIAFGTELIAHLEGTGGAELGAVTASLTALFVY